MHKKQGRLQIPLIIIIKPCHIPGKQNKDSRKELYPDSRYQNVTLCWPILADVVKQEASGDSKNSLCELRMRNIRFASLQSDKLGCSLVPSFSPSTLWCELKPRAGIFGPPAVFHLAHPRSSSRNVSTKVTTTHSSSSLLFSVGCLHDKCDWKELFKWLLGLCLGNCIKLV